MEKAKVVPKRIRFELYPILLQIYIEKKVVYSNFFLKTVHKRSSLRVADLTYKKGMCWNLRYLLKLKKNENWIYVHAYLGVLFPELDKHRTRESYSALWWNNNEERATALTNIIKEEKANINQNNTNYEKTNNRI